MAINIRVDSPNIKYTEEFIQAKYEYHTTKITENNNNNVTVSIIY